MLELSFVLLQLFAIVANRLLAVSKIFQKLSVLIQNGGHGPRQDYPFVRKAGGEKNFRHARLAELVKRHQPFA